MKNELARSVSAFNNELKLKRFNAFPKADVDLYDKTDLIPFDKLIDFFTKNL
jgi:hypothetical protein